MICEKCWGDAYGRMMGNGRSQSDNYHELLKEREANPCTPEQQRGEDDETQQTKPDGAA